MKMNFFYSILVLFITAFQVIFSIHFSKYVSMINPDALESNCYYSLVEKKVTQNSFNFILAHQHPSHQSNKHSSITSDFLKLEIFLISNDIIQFIFRDANTTRFELPRVEPFPFHKYPPNMIVDYNMNNLNYDYEFLIREEPFSLSISRRDTKEIIFSTFNNPIIFQENYCEITTDIPSENLFGLGERTTNFKLKSGTYTFYNHDLYGELEDGSGQGKNRYGSHPMYLMREKSGFYHVSYLRNSFPMDVIVKHSIGTVTYKIAGGVLDFTLFLGDENPETAIKKYHSFLGGYAMPPFFAMGFHQSRWGYRNLTKLEYVLSKYQINDLPMDTLWMDIDYMKESMPFTWDKDRYNPKDFNKLLARYKKKFILISEPSMGIKNPNYEWYVKGIQARIFVQNSNGYYLLNKVWPGKVHFIDYFNPKAKAYWEAAHQQLYSKVNFSGIWLDMNEIATFSNGEIDMDEEQISCNDKKIYPYFPGGNHFEKNTVCPNAIHYNNYKHIEVHNYYSVQQAMLTYEMLEHMFPDQFPFILTRANAPGMGRYSAHWSGDNYGLFDWYKLSISEVMNGNLFGMPMMGTDICGFGGNTPEDLCAKWYQMGSLFPFSRSHNHLDYYNKEPFEMGSLLLTTTRKSLMFRYSILKYYYSLFMKNKGKGTIFRPLFFEFYQDPNVLDNKVIDTQFMIGSDLLVVPNLNQDISATSTTAYFPIGDWYDLRDYKKIQKNAFSFSGNLVVVDTRLNEMPAVFLRSGKTIFMNNVEKVTNTYGLSNGFSFLIALDDWNSNESSSIVASKGRIPALTDYHSRSQVEQCMGKGKTCMINIYSSYDVITQYLNISFSKAEIYPSKYSDMTIIKFVLFFSIDNMISKVEVDKTNLEELIFTPSHFLEDKFRIKILNANSIEILINGELRIPKKELDIFIKFK